MKLAEHILAHGTAQLDDGKATITLDVPCCLFNLVIVQWDARESRQPLQGKAEFQIVTNGTDDTLRFFTVQHIAWEDDVPSIGHSNDRIAWVIQAFDDPETSREKT